MSLQEEIDGLRPTGGTVSFSGEVRISKALHVWEDVQLVGVDQGTVKAVLRPAEDFPLRNLAHRSIVYPYSRSRFENITFCGERVGGFKPNDFLQPLFLDRPVVDVEFANCTFSKAWGLSNPNDPKKYEADAVQLKGGCHDIRFYSCKFMDGHRHNLGITHATHVTFHDCEFSGKTSYLNVDLETHGGKVRNVYFVGCTFANTGHNASEQVSAGADFKFLYLIGCNFETGLRIRKPLDALDPSAECEVWGCTIDGKLSTGDSGTECASHLQLNDSTFRQGIDARIHDGVIARCNISGDCNINVHAGTLRECAFDDATLEMTLHGRCHVFKNALRLRNDGAVTYCDIVDRSQFRDNDLSGAQVAIKGIDTRKVRFENNSDGFVLEGK